MFFYCRSPNEVDEQILNKELQLVQFPITNYQHQLSNLKVDPDQVELLITDQNTGISYSGFVSQVFTNLSIARSFFLLIIFFL